MSTKKSPRKTAPTKEEQSSDETGTSLTRPLKWKTVESKQLNLRLVNLYPPNSKESRRLFRALEEEVEYLSPETTRIKLFGKLHDIPRRNVGYGDKSVVYKYSGLSLEAKEWTPTLREIKSDVESASGHSYNFVLVNRYADGGDCMGEHRDDEAELDPDVPIASLSLGAARDFYFKHADARSGKDKSIKRVNLVLNDGLLLLMEKPTNRFWYHALPRRKNSPGTRINLTFRKVK